MTKIVLTTLCLTCLATVAFAEKYPQLTTRADALRACNVSSQERWHRGTAYDYESNRRSDYSACMFQRGQAD
jgi:hypothetical protein